MRSRINCQRMFGGRVLRFLSTGIFSLLTVGVVVGQQSSILIVADKRCSLRVDTQPLGAVAAGQGKLARVSAGDHLIEAQAGGLKWEATVRVEKPGQIVVKTGLSNLKAAAKWVGEWNGSTDYGEVTLRSGDTAFYAHHFERYTIRVMPDSGCSVTHENSFANGFNSNGESEYALVQRVIVNARTANFSQQTLACGFTPGGGIEGGGVSVSADGNLTFTKWFGDKGVITVPLERKK
jgi:hypothetical protein